MAVLSEARWVLRWIVIGVAVVAAGAVLAACGSDEEGSSSAPAVEANPDLTGEVTIGAVVPTTGDSATIGEDQARGVELAVEQVNSEDGVLGKELAVAIEDSQSDTVSGVQAARKLVSVDKAPLVSGEYISARTLAAGKYLQNAGVVHINPGSSSTDITEIGDFSFSSIALDDIAGDFAAESLYDAGYRRIAFLGPNNPYGATFATVIEDRFTALGGEITESILYTEGESTYRPELERLQASEPELYVYASYVPDAITINEEAFELGIDPQDFYGIYLSIGIEDVDPAATAGQQGQDLSFEGPEGEQFQQAYEDKYGEDVRTPYSAYMYDSILMAAAAINEAGSEDPEEIRVAMETVGQDFAGATGSISFDADGQRDAQEYSLLEVDEEGAMQPVTELVGPDE